MSETIGELNANPFNLRFVPTIAWEGLASPPQDEHGFCRFITIAFGLRAGFRDLYVASHLGFNTIRKLVAHFAPPTENPTDAYIAAVAQHTGIAADTQLDLSLSAQLRLVGIAFLRQENGLCIYTDDQLATAVSEALAA